MSKPILLEPDIRSLLESMGEITCTVNSREYSQLGIISLRETWLHEEADEAFVSVEEFTYHRVERPGAYRDRGDGVIIYASNCYCVSSKVLFRFFSPSISRLFSEL
ncbi:unnamed protein product [Dicrocoelium dendriticum]|nr:unnamed protein product [Dicrocoelium dendriticum]